MRRVSEARGGGVRWAIASVTILIAAWATIGRGDEPRDGRFAGPGICPVTNRPTGDCCLSTSSLGRPSTR